MHWSRALAPRLDWLQRNEDSWCSVNSQHMYGNAGFDAGVGLGQILHDQLLWLDVPDRVLFKLAVTVHQCLNGRVPPYLSQHCVSVRPAVTDQTRQTRQNAPIWLSGRLNSHRHTRHDKPVLSVSCLAWRCELILTAPQAFSQGSRSSPTDAGRRHGNGSLGHRVSGSFWSPFTSGSPGHHFDRV